MRFWQRLNLLIMLMLPFLTMVISVPTNSAAAVISTTWTEQGDFENNAATTGETTSRLDADTTTQPGALRIGAKNNNSMGPAFGYYMTKAVYNSRDKNTYVIYYTGEKTYIGTLDHATGRPKYTANCGMIVIDAVYNEADNRIYLVDDYQISVYDCSTKSITKTMELGNRSNGARSYTVVLNPTANKIYIGLQSYAGTILAFDCATQTVSTVANGFFTGTTSLHYPQMAYNATSDRLYVASRTVNELVSLDCTAGTLLKKVTISAYVPKIFYDGAASRLYVPKTDSSLTIYDSELNILEAITLPASPKTATFIPQRNEIYLTNSDNSLTVFNCSTSGAELVSSASVPGANPIYEPALDVVYLMSDTAAHQSLLCVDLKTRKAKFKVEYVGVGSVTYNQNANVMYMIENFYPDKRLLVIDPLNNKIISSLNLPSGLSDVAVMAHDLNKLYISGTNVTAVFDCATNQIVKTIPTPGSSQMGYNPLHKKLYITATYSGSVLVLDCQTDTLIAPIATGGYPGKVIVPKDKDKIYVAHAYSSGTYVIDGATDTATYTTLFNSCSGYSSISNKLYCNGKTIDPDTASIVGSYAHPTVSNGYGGVYQATVIYSSYNPSNNQLYLTTAFQSQLSIVDCATDTLSSLPLTANGGAIAFSPANNSIYVKVGSNSTANIEQIGQFATSARIGGEETGKTGLRIDTHALDAGVVFDDYNLRIKHAELRPSQGVRLQIRTADDLTSLATASYFGPDGSSSAWYDNKTIGATTTPDQDGRYSTVIPLINLLNYQFVPALKRYVEVQVELVSDGGTPIVDAISLDLFTLDPPAAADLELLSADGASTITKPTNATSALLQVSKLPLTISPSVYAQFEIMPVAGSFTEANILNGDNLAGAISRTLVTLAEGSYKWRARLVDAVGRRSGWTQYAGELTIDTTPPQLGVNAQTISGTMDEGSTISISASTSANIGEIYYTTPTSWSCRISNLPMDDSFVVVVAQDVAGNITSATIPIKGFTSH